ncbi:MASE4 domain-containing protein [Zavarzinia sp. CC-PAN008]|uniref:MASE4 domain-containing protein n=1 Tax=Zavarzinia sp. CC-PAN008 TaxID=3243332 RepID=UPI003F745A73
MIEAPGIDEAPESLLPYAFRNPYPGKWLQCRVEQDGAVRVVMFQAETLADTQAGPLHRVMATLVAVLLSGLTLWSLAGNVQLAKLTSFMPATIAAIAVVELITALMLLTQFWHLRRRPLAWLGGAYLFAGLIVIPFVLTFPEAFSESGLMGAGPQTTSWMWMFWHVGFPAIVLGYIGCVLRDPALLAPETVANLIPLVVILALAAVVGVTVLATLGHDHLPVVFASGSYSGITTSGIGPLAAVLCVVGLVGLWHATRLRTVLNLWLAVALFAFLLDILGVLFGHSRYTFSWYVARVNGLVSAFTVLCAFLVEINALYQHLLTAAQRTAEDNDRLVEAEAALRQRSGVLQAAFEGLAEAVCALDQNRRLIAWNRRFFSLFGFPDDYARVGMPAEAFARFNAERGQYGPGDVDAIVRQQVQVLETDRFMTYELDRPDGSTLEVQMTPLPTGGVLVTMREITDRKQAEARLRAEKTATEEQLAQLQKMESLGHLTGGLAHDFNNLLGVVIGNLDLLMEEMPRQGPAREMGEAAIDAALRGAELTRQLLAFARRQPLRPKLLDANVVVADTARLLSRTLGEQVRIHLVPQEQGLWPVMADPALLESALVNIATNARDAMPNGGTLTVRTANSEIEQDYADSHGDVRAGDYVMIELTDTGSGMPPEVVARVFEPFFTTKEVGRGTGLGLSMVYGFIRQSGGHVQIYSEQGRGTVIRLYLPRALQVGEQSSGATDRRRLMATGNEPVLVVDDNPHMRTTAAKQLSSLGYAVFEAEDAASALDTLAAHPIALLFTDLVMPGRMSGADLAAEAQARQPDLRVIFTSGFPQNARPDDGPQSPRRLPDDAVLLGKPYRKADLAALVRRVLDS